MLTRLIKQCSHRISRSFAKSIPTKHSIRAKVLPQADAKVLGKMSRNMKEFVLELNTPFEELDCQEAFDNLTEIERKYLHFYSKVSESAFFLCLHFLQRTSARFIYFTTSRYKFELLCLSIITQSTLPGVLVWLAYLVCTNLARGTVDLLVVPSHHYSRGCSVLAGGLFRSSHWWWVYCEYSNILF